MGATRGVAIARNVERRNSAGAGGHIRGPRRYGFFDCAGTQALAKRERVEPRQLAIDDPLQIRLAAVFGINLGRPGRLDEARAALPEPLKFRVKFGPELEDFMTHAQGVLSHAQGRLGEAEAEFRCLFAKSESALGPNHPRLLGQLFSLAEVIGQPGRRKEAAVFHNRAKQILEVNRDV